MKPALRIVDSITELVPGADAGCVAVSGSHGGISSARYALAALPFLQDQGVAACAVSHQSARIGDARSTWATGVISHCNALAEALGAAPGTPCAELVQRLTSGPAPPLPHEMV